MYVLWYRHDSRNIQLLIVLLGLCFICSSIDELSVEHIRLSTFM